MSPHRHAPRWPALAAALLAACAGPQIPAAQAHQGNATAYAAITVSGRTVRYALTLSAIPPGPLANRIRGAGPGAAPDYRPLLEAIAEHVALSSDAGACAPAPGHVTPPSATALNVTAVVDFACPAPVRELLVEDGLFDVLGDDLHTLARIDTAAGTQQFAFATESRQARVVIGQRAPAAQGTGSLVALGVEHILTGYDHLLFILALILCGGGLKRLLLVVTAFTVAHSVTLALAVTELVTLPGRLVESLIALSIAYVAAENLFPRLALSRRWTVSFGFGLVHGFGFSGVLIEMGLPRQNLLLALLGFNVGVEVGQALVLLLAFPLLWWSARGRERPPLAAPISGVILAIGLGLFVERAFL